MDRDDRLVAPRDFSGFNRSGGKGGGNIYLKEQISFTHWYALDNGSSSCGRGLLYILMFLSKL
jgi:hypothetical protein